jgi:hypothetical protein
MSYAIAAVIKAFAVLFAVAALCGCAPQKEPAAAGPTLVATIDRQNGVAFVDPVYADRVAKRWGVQNASADEWTITRGSDQPVKIRIVRKKTGLGALTGESTWFGCKCTGNNPPGTDDTQCMAGPGGAGSMKITQNVGYSFCAASSSEKDECDATQVQVGDWVYYKDGACQTETRRLPFTRSVCLPTH